MATISSTSLQNRIDFNTLEEEVQIKYLGSDYTQSEWKVIEEKEGTFRIFDIYKKSSSYTSMAVNIWNTMKLSNIVDQTFAAVKGQELVGQFYVDITPVEEEEENQDFFGLNAEGKQGMINRDLFNQYIDCVFDPEVVSGLKD